MCTASLVLLLLCRLCPFARWRAVVEGGGKGKSAFGGSKPGDKIDPERGGKNARLVKWEMPDLPWGMHVFEHEIKKET